MKDGQKVCRRSARCPATCSSTWSLNDDSWQLVKGTPGVTGFVGASNEPVPLTQPEVDRLLHREVAQKVATKAQFSIGESVKVDLRPAVGLLRRDLRDQPGRREAQGPGVDLRSRDAGRSRLRPGQEDLGRRRWLRKSSHRSSCRPPAGRRRPAPPVGPALGQHGINIMEFCKAFNAQTQDDAGAIDPGRDHGLRGPLVHVHHQDAARRRADQAGASASTRARASRTRTRSARSRRTSSARSPRRSSPTSTPTTSTRRRRSSPAPPARWAWR